MKRLIILGSAGSIGQSTLQIVEALPDDFTVTGLAVDRNTDEVLAQAAKFGVKHVAVANPRAAKKAQADAPSGVHVTAGPEAVAALAGMDDADVVVGAIVGMAGLEPILAAIERGREIALATKEVLVAAGEVVTSRAKARGATLLPVDSEPSAIFQCLAGKPGPSVRRLILTASGGPFTVQEDLDLTTVSPAQALNHPRWDMGQKVTIDSATLMNKGLEIMESRWLFDMSMDSIDVVIHPESIVHSMVEFIDGSVLAQLSVPDMRFAIQYALTHPQRLDGRLPGLNLMELGALHFREPDDKRFPCLQLARSAGSTGGTMPAALNAANEIAVHRFLREDIRFPGIWKIVEEVMTQHNLVEQPSLDDVIEADRWARTAAEEIRC
jgi:1-deoxy-D-xylulose-5-phosphate reductoisomerase